MLSLGQGVLQCTQIAHYLRMTILYFYKEIFAWSQPRRVLQYNATTFRMTILFFYKDILLGLSQGVFYSTSATTFRMTILLFCKEIYAYSWPRRVLVYKNRATTFWMTILYFCRKHVLACFKTTHYISLQKNKLVLAKQSYFCYTPWPRISRYTFQKNKIVNLILL